MNKLQLKEESRKKLFEALKNTNTVINSNELTTNISVSKLKSAKLLTEDVNDSVTDITESFESELNILIDKYIKKLDEVELTMDENSFDTTLTVIYDYTDKLVSKFKKIK